MHLLVNELCEYQNARCNDKKKLKLKEIFILNSTKIQAPSARRISKDSFTKKPKLHFRIWVWLRPIKTEMKSVGHFNICIYTLGRTRYLFLPQNILTCSGAHPAHLQQHGMQKEYYKYSHIFIVVP